MASYRFGTSEEITCITPVQVKGAKGEALCLAFKTSTRFVLLGVSVHDDGYVLGVQGEPKSYYPLPADRVGKLQEASLIPSPLPAYTIPTLQYFVGYSLWWALALAAVLWGLGQWRRRRRNEARRTMEATTPIGYGPPVLKTDVDRFVDAQVRPLLRPGEVVQHQAYTADRPLDGSGLDAIAANAFYVVLTSQRFFFFKSRIGAFGPLLENRGTETLERSQVTGAAVDDLAMTLHLAGGGARNLFILQTKKVSNQNAFLLDVPRILREARAPEAQHQIAVAP